MKVPLLQLINFICIMVQEGEVGGVHSCQNQTGAFKNWDRTKLPKHGENAQLCRHFEKGKEKRKKKILLIASRDADLYCLYCHWDLKGALMAGASQR